MTNNTSTTGESKTHLEAKKEKENRGIQGLKDLLCGIISGMCGKVLEYPLDTVKVRLQTQTTGGGGGAQPGRVVFKGPVDCLVKTFKNEGFRGMYKGLTSPLLGAMMENAVLFVSYAQIKRTIQTDENTPLTLPQLCLSGAGAGVFSSLVLTPIELIKCRLQVQQNETPAYKGPIDCLVKTIKTDGVPGLFRGFSGTLMREIPGNAAWFGVYEAACLLQTPQNGKRSDLGALQLMTAGAFAGMFYWLVPFPADVIKSNMQIAGGEGGKSSVGFVATFKKIYKAEGVKGFYKGCGITVARAAPSNAVIFATYELCRRYLG
eukprot:TRINITY_DN1923_c0_g3_i1.p1 TRINITY_DN1923_c0_g3~~TRINITY_DN1923_c0_g3_i1.p1  ORF type:complete len:331 (-),score=69.72 TRINITY_DN1923_c0_g3_i1:127-1083(-)